MPLRPRPMATARTASTTTSRLPALRRLRPLNLYGWSKHLFDLAVIARARRGETMPPQWVGLKFFNVFGPNEYHKGEMMSLIAKRFQDAQDGHTVRLFKSHRARHRRRRPAPRFHLCRRRGRSDTLVSRPRVSGMFNVGTGEARSFRDMITAMFPALGREPAHRICRHAGQRSATSTSISREPRSKICARPATTPASRRSKRRSSAM